MAWSGSRGYKVVIHCDIYINRIARVSGRSLGKMDGDGWKEKLASAPRIADCSPFSTPLGVADRRHLVL